MKWRIFPVLLLLLLTTSCIFDSGEVSRAKADYIEARTRELNARARIKEAEARLREQQVEQAQRNSEAAAARRGTLEELLVQTLRVLAYIVAATVVVVTLFWAISGAHKVWAEDRLKLLEASEREAKAKAQAMREEQLAHQARANAFAERRNLIEAETRRLEQERLLTKMSDNGHTSQSEVSHV